LPVLVATFTMTLAFVGYHGGVEKMVSTFPSAVFCGIINPLMSMLWMVASISTVSPTGSFSKRASV